MQTGLSDVFPLRFDLYRHHLAFRPFHIYSNMSLPTATRDTTEHPAKNAVSAPVNKQEKAADVDRKVLLFRGLIFVC
jgi:hypothetical protein